MRVPLSLLALWAASARAAAVQLAGLTLPDSAAANRDAVQKIFTDSFAAYTKFAFGHDSLDPETMTAEDDRNGFGGSIVDALSTMLVMNLTDLYQTGLNFTANIDFSVSHTASTVSVFETTIRYLGGMLSAYELNGMQDAVLLSQATKVGDKLAYAWVGDNDIPYGELNFTTNTPVVDGSNIAEAGTLSLEFSRLSLYTGNDTYRQLAERSVRHIAGLVSFTFETQRSLTVLVRGTVLDGLAPQCIDPTAGTFSCDYVTWGGGSDSYFEYLIKYGRLTNTVDDVFIRTWQRAVDSSISTLMKSSTVGDHVYLADFDGSQIRHVGSHLACFHGGNWILGGKLLGNDTIVNAGLALVDGCINTYMSTTSGIGPETFAYISSDGNFTGGDDPSASDLQFNSDHGFYITGGDYDMRPEVMESNFYAWRATGDTKYLDNAAAMVNSINTYLKGAVGFDGLDDVENPSNGFLNHMETFWFAEVLKYLYLTFDNPNHISLDEWVFNTECHPFKAPPELPSYNPSTPVNCASTAKSKRACH